jgi:quercetin dioxygenase-like cupin family protein
MNLDAIIRRPLLTASLGERRVTRVEVREISFRPGQRTPRHLHPCPVVGYIAEGTALYQREDESAPQLLQAGAAFYEPADAVVLHFDNASETEPMRFIAYYLLDGEQELIELLPEA